MSNPYAFIGLPNLGSAQASGSNGAGGPMSLGHNLGLGNLPFPAALMQAAAASGGQVNGIPGLPFGMQPGLGLAGHLSGLLGQRMASAPGPVPRQEPPEIMLDGPSTSKEGERYQMKGSRESRKRARTNSLTGDSDDDIMVLSNSPSSSINEPAQHREAAKVQPTGVWENSALNPMAGLGFSLPNPALYPNDPSSFIAAMGSQMPFDFGLMSGVMSNMPSNPTKEPIHLKTCTLIPPNPQAPLPTTRERPLGCKTVFVGGLAENITEDTLREIFERCGSILTIRMSKKNFAHVRFERECFVDAAIQLSGYRIRLNNQKAADVAASASNTSSGRLHVDFAQARDDQYEYECQARRMEREMRHRQRIEEDKWRPPSPPPVPHYAEHEAHVVVEQLKNEDRFGRAVQILATWLERGDCSKRNANGFYSMIQSAHAHLRRLGSEKSQLEEEARRTHDSLRQKFHHLISQLGEMERLFQAANHQKAWDHFTKAQRKSLESWRKHVTDLKLEPTVEFLRSGKSSNGDGDNMEFSDSELDEPRYKGPAEKSIAHLKEENDSLRCQLEAYKNEVEIVRSDLKLELQAKEQQVKILEEEVRGLKDKALSTRPDQSPTVESTSTSNDDRSTKLLSLLSVYLSIQHLGASVDDIVTFARKTDGTYTKEEVESLLVRSQQLFSRCPSDLWRFKLFFSS